MTPAQKSAKQKKKLVETPAFGTKTKGFFRDGNISSREGSRDKQFTSGFSTPGVSSRTKKLKGSVVETSKSSTPKLEMVSQHTVINETMVNSTKRILQDKVKPFS